MMKPSSRYTSIEEGSVVASDLSRLQVLLSHLKVLLMRESTVLQVTVRLGAELQFTVRLTADTGSGRKGEKKNRCEGFGNRVLLSINI